MPRLALPQRELELEYELHGPEHGPAVILVMGLGMQLLAWPRPLVDGLAAAGFRVVLFDNRDAGLSTSGHVAPHTSVPLALLASLLGRRFRPPYTLHDMADDTLALADALGIERFHVVGVSMGGMIGQVLATRAPQRVQSLVSIMSSAGPGTAPRPAPDVMLKVLQRPPAGAEHRRIHEHFVGVFRTLGRIEAAAELEVLSERLDRTLKRAYKPAGTSRQLLAIMASPDRSFEVSRIHQPTLILHGTIDPLVRPEAAHRLAALIPGAKLEWLEGMGHYMPVDAVPRLTELVLGFLQALTPKAAPGPAERPPGM